MTCIIEIGLTKDNHGIFVLQLDKLSSVSASIFYSRIAMLLT